MVKYLSLYIKYIRQFFLGLLEYRLDFIFGVISMAFIHIGTFAFIYLVFEKIHKIGGFSFYEVSFILGFSIIPQSLVTMFASTLFNFSWYVRNGEFDRILLRPLNPLFQVISSRFDQNGIGNFFVGMVIVFYSWKQLSIDFNFYNLFFFIIFLVSATLILFSINLVVASLSFFIIRNDAIVMMIHELDEFSYYPLTIYNKGIKFMLTFLIPMAFSGFFPSLFFINNKYCNISLYTIPVSFILFSISYLFFNYGISRYESVGH